MLPLVGKGNLKREFKVAMQRCLAKVDIDCHQFWFVKTTGTVFFGLAIFLLLVQSLNAAELNQSLNYSGVQLITTSQKAGAENIGTYNNGTWYLDLNGDGVYSSGVDRNYLWGGAGYQPVVGDWNGDNKTEIGTMNAVLGDWWLDYDGSGTWTSGDRNYHWGKAGYQPVVGDWNGDTKTEIGTMNAVLGDWWLDYDGSGTWTSGDKNYHWGGAGYQPVVGDWNGDNKTEIGTMNAVLGDWWLDYDGSGTWTSGDKNYHWGGAGYQPVVGDWNGDRKTEIGTMNAVLGDWWLDYDGSGTWTSGDKDYHWGAPGYAPVVAKWITESQVPISAFTSDVQSGNAPLTVKFTDQSTGTAPLAYAWDFTNDGVNDSTTQSSSFTYSTAGTYTVRLTATNAAGSDAEIKTGYITVSPAPVAPTAAFTSNKQTGTAPLTVKFTDQSTGTAPLAYAWDFTNDGVNDSTTQSPSFTYNAGGTYTVRLTVTNAAGSDETIKTGYITVTAVPVAPTAAFTSNKQTGTAPLTVKFTDTSTGSPTSWLWSFGDGNLSILQSPSFTYSAAGTYTVKLTVTNYLGTDVESKTGYITVTEGQPGGSHAGIALTFDDNSIDQWYEIRNLLKQYNAHVTFFVTGFQNLDEERIAKLRALQADGHEIAYHGMYHEDAAAYVKTHTIQQYLDYEIIPGVNLMKNAGLTPVDFAYPYGSENDSLTTALQVYFVHVRGTHSQINNPIFYEYGSNQLLIEGVGIDDQTYGNTINEIYDGISRAKQEDTILIFYAHVPVQTVTGDYMISYDRLEKILKNVSENNMKFYTVSELS